MVTAVEPTFHTLLRYIEYLIRRSGRYTAGQWLVHAEATGA
jgi:hypothetical protein